MIERPKHWLIIDKILDRFMLILVAASLYTLFAITVLLLWGFRSESLVLWIIAILVLPVSLALGEGLLWLFLKIPPIRYVRESVETSTKEGKISGLRILWILFKSILFLSLMIIVGITYFIIESFLKQ